MAQNDTIQETPETSTETGEQTTDVNAEASESFIDSNKEEQASTLVDRIRERRGHPQAEKPEAKEDATPEQAETQEGQTETETTAKDSQGEAKPESTDEKKDEDGWPDRYEDNPEWAQKLIDREVRKRKELREELEGEYASKLTELEQKLQDQGGESKKDPEAVENISDVNTFNERVNNANEVLEWADGAFENFIANPDLDSVEANGETYTREDVVNIRRNVRSELKELGKRQPFVEQYAQLEEKAKTAFPALYDPQSEQYNKDAAKQAEAVLEAYPELKKYPDHKLRAAELLVGRLELNRRMKQGQKKGEGESAKGKTTDPKKGGEKPETPIVRRTQSNTQPVRKTGPDLADLRKRAASPTASKDDKKKFISAKLNRFKQKE